VTTKVGRFEVTEAARLTLGQPQSTINPRTLLRDGGVLVVDIAVGPLGEGGSALIGATLLNLLGLVVEDQIDLPAAQRSRMVALIDESSTLGGADYPRWRDLDTDVGTLAVARPRLRAGFDRVQGAEVSQRPPDDRALGQHSASSAPSHAAGRNEAQARHGMAGARPYPRAKMATRWPQLLRSLYL